MDRRADHHLDHPTRSAPARWGVVAGGVIGMLVLTGCGGDGDASPASAPSALTSSPTVSASSSVPITAPPTTITATTASYTTTSTAPASSDSPIVAAWCGPAARVRAASDRFEAATTDADAVRVAIDELVVAVQEAAEVAPRDIADAVARTEELVLELDRALAAAGYDLLTADLSVVSERAGELEAANEVIRDYNGEFCGFEPRPTTTEDGDDDDDDDAGSDGFDFGAGSFRDQFIGRLVDDGFTLPEAACLFGEIDFADPGSYTGDAAVVRLFAACGIDPGRVGELSVTGDGS